jgi:hypothetical protein
METDAPIARELAAVEAEQQRCGDYLREHGMPTGRDLGAALGAQDQIKEEVLVRREIARKGGIASGEARRKTA